MVAVDCNVLVHLLLEGEQTPRARALLEHDADWHSEALMMVELTNASHFDALATAAHYRISAYDAHYLVVARNLGVKLVTEDARLRKSAPELTQSLAEAVGY